MITIALTQGQVAIVDDIDADLADFKWYAHRQRLYSSVKFFAQRKIVNEGKKTIAIMHRVILSRMLGRPLLYSDKVDHIHGDTLDNRRSELRLATNSQNAANSGKYSTNTSGYKGVTWHKRGRKWQAQIKVNGKNIYLGLYDTREAASEVYQRKATEEFGEFANFGRAA